MSERAKQLIQAAFQRARESGKSDWHRMSLAVLKNRILQLTDHAFREQEYGVRSFTEFVKLASEIADIDESTRPPIVVLRTETAAAEATSDKQLALSVTPTAPILYADAPSTRIRPDLWNAVMDYRSGTRYGWDATQLRARRMEEGETLPVLPTITPEEERKWRTEFAAAQERGLSTPQVDRLHYWRDAGLASTALPGQMRKPWNAELKRRAAALLQRWFEQQAITPPAILVHAETTRPGADDGEELRRFLLDCVRSMTPQELATLNIPASVVLRVRK